MGMFDYLRCDMPLPSKWPSDGFRFQTKDTDAQYMERYTITADGLLIHHMVRYEGVPREERPFPDAEPGDWRSICGIVRSIPTGDVEVPMHGDLNFYEMKDGAWISFVARFTEGRCVHIRTVEHQPAPTPHPEAAATAMMEEGR